MIKIVFCNRRNSKKKIQLSSERCPSEDSSYPKNVDTVHIIISFCRMRNARFSDTFEL